MINTVLLVSEGPRYQKHSTGTRVTGLINFFSYIFHFLLELKTDKYRPCAFESLDLEPCQWRNRSTGNVIGKDQHENKLPLGAS